MILCILFSVRLLACNIYIMNYNTISFLYNYYLPQSLQITNE